MSSKHESVSTPKSAQTTKTQREPKKPREHYKLRTRLIHGSFATGRWDYDHHVVPPQSASVTYRLKSAHRGAEGFAEYGSDTAQKAPIYIYDRLDEPTRGMLEENLAVAEAGDIAVCYASGMAAISAAICSQVSMGHQVVAHRVIYGCTHELMTTWLPRWGVETLFCDMSDPANIAKVATRDTRVVYFESPVNPTMELIDIAAVRAVVDKLNEGREAKDKMRILVDNTFATPFCQRPLELGADLAINSLTKGIGGFGTEVGGVVVGKKSDYHSLMLFRKDFGGVLSPRNSWPILVYGLPTLAARMVNQQKAAMHVAEFLQKQPKIERVVYPGLPNFPQLELAKRQMVSYDGKFAPGSMLYFELKGADKGAAERFVDFIAEHAYTITLAVSLGQIKTLIESPFSMTHSAIPEEAKISGGMHPGGIRLSLGLEDWHDITNDLEAALAVV